MGLTCSAVSTPARPITVDMTDKEGKTSES